MYSLVVAVFTNFLPDVWTYFDLKTMRSFVGLDGRFDNRPSHSFTIPDHRNRSKYVPKGAATNHKE